MNGIATSEQILEFINYNMKKKGITCITMAKHFSVDKSTMSRKLSGVTAMSVDDIPIYADVLGLFPYEIYMARKLDSGQIRVLEKLYEQHKKSKSGYVPSRANRNSEHISYDMVGNYAMYFYDLFDAMLKREEKNSING